MFLFSFLNKIILIIPISFKISAKNVLFIV